jgi:hypothetical protein
MTFEQAIARVNEIKEAALVRRAEFGKRMRAEGGEHEYWRQCVFFEDGMISCADQVLFALKNIDREMERSLLIRSTVARCAEVAKHAGQFASDHPGCQVASEAIIREVKDGLPR